MKVYHRITEKTFDTIDYENNIKTIGELKQFICNKMGGIKPENIKFIKNAEEIKGGDVLLHNSVEFIIVPIKCEIH